MPNTFKFIEEGQEVKIPLEQWGWIAIYKDGSFLKQFDEMTHLFHQFKEIDLPKLDVFVMQNLEHPEDPSKRFEIHVEEGMKIIHFYRKGEIAYGTPNATPYKIYCFGYEENIGGKTVKTLFSIHENGAVSIKNTDGKK